ncbi:MAG: DUF1214 domain-containing protein [Desulfobacter sp.]|nr:DUF1214 domain-containing protein [Desulfobacter sp.]WDP84986.1 MAG: DUF1214 domain-containing protein [Desulfobacter sp.]
MNLKIRNFYSVGILLLAIVSAPVYAGEKKSDTSENVPVTLDKFATAETHFMMQLGVDTQDSFGKWFHDRGFTPIDKQNVVRMNRDTLYSSVVLDLTEPATIIKPDIQGRYQSLLVVNEGHFATLVAYKPGKYTLTKEKMGSRYVAVIVRTLVDAEDPDDLAEAHRTQDGLKVIQKSKGKFEVPNWDREALKEMREALKVLGKYLPIRDTAYGGSIDEVDPIAHIVGTADTWGGWKPENAVYRSYVPQKNDGKTPYTVTLKNVPAAKDAFWSISVYNSEGFFQENEHNKYVINSRKAKADKDGSVTIHFGGDSSKENFLPIMPGWNYMLRIYLPQKAYFDGTWKAPEAEPVK